MTEIITTVGPASLNKETLDGLRRSGANDFRINLSHCDEQLLDQTLAIFHDSEILPSIDTQGAQLRVLPTHENHFFNINDTCLIAYKNSTLQSVDLLVNHQELFRHIMVGDKLRIDFGGLVLQVTHIHSSFTHLESKVVNPGSVSSNRAVDVINRPIKLESLTSFDIYAIENFFQFSSGTIYASFASSGNDIQHIRDLCSLHSNGKEVKIVAKIESKLGISALQDIIDHSDAILIDRGDLSREISISRIPMATKAIVNKCKSNSTPCYVATNILDSMISGNIPSRAEISDLYTLLDIGVNGIVLAAEVAIGRNPIDCVKIVNHMINLHDADISGFTSLLPHSSDISLLPTSLADWL